MDLPSRDFVFAGSLDELKAKGRLVLHGDHRPILVIHDRGRVFALDNRCPHMGFPLERGSVEDGILTCHWHHARFDLESGDRKSTRLNSSHMSISYAVFCLKKKTKYTAVY